VLRLGDEDYALVIVRDVTEQRMIQESLKQSEERYRAIVENQIELVGRATPDGSLTFANEAFCQYLHMTRDQMIGYRFSEHVYPEDTGYVGAAFGSLSSDNPSVMIEHRFVMPDGQVRWHQWTNLALFDADGNLLEIQGVGRDITERKQLEDKVRASQELYRSLIESSDHMVLTVDHQGIIQFASELTASLLDLPVEQVVGQAFGAVFPSDYATEQLERIHEVIQRGSGIAFESPTYSADQWYRTSIQPVRDAAGATVAALLNITDITEFKRTEVALRASEAKLAEAQRVVLLGYWDWDTERDAVYISDEVCVIFGVDVQTVPVPRHNLLQSVHPDDQSALLDALQRARSGKSFQIDLRIVRSDAVQRYVHVRTSNASVSSSSPAHVFGTIQDISERKQLENELKLLNTELEQRVSERTREVKRQASAMDSTRAGMSLLIDGRFIYMNTALADMYGYSIAQLIGESWTRLFHPDEVLMLQQRVLPLLVQEGAWTGEVLGKRRDDTSFDAEVTLQYSSSGELIFTCNDISLRKQMERQLRSSEARYRVLLEQAPVALLVNDYNPDTRTYRIVYANPAAVNLLGAAGSQDLIGHSAYEFMSESSRELSLNRIHQYLGETNPGPAEYEYYRIDTGELIYMQVASILIEYSDQSAFLSVLVDITDRRRFETELRKSEERYRAILETQKELICRFTPDTTLTYVNPAYCDYFGKTEEQLIGQSWLNLLPVSSRDSVNSTVNALIDKGGSITYEHQVMRDDGKIYWQQWTDQLLDNPTNGAIEIQSVGVDITELKQIQTHLEAALAKERELSELKSRFVSMTSHEFRTPLASIRATSETLRDFYERMSETDRQKRFERINSQIEHMAAMLDDILLIGRLEEGQIQANFEHLRFSDYLRSMLEEFRSIRLNHQLVFHCEANDLQVYADRKLVRQIFTNLLTNASQYSAPDSRIEIRMVQDGGEVVLQVIDEGIGIPDADQKHLFTAFHRAENVGNIKGTGLGLAIAKRAVELHRGSISFKSKVGVGTTFTVRFPIEQTPEMQYQRGQ
jgi:PAS domain S-box-containing protein